MSLFVVFACILVVFWSFKLCSWFFEHWGQGSNLSRTRPFFTRAKSDAVCVWGLIVGHGYLSMAVLFSSIEATLIEEQH